MISMLYNSEQTNVFHSSCYTYFCRVIVVVWENGIIMFRVISSYKIKRKNHDRLF